MFSTVANPKAINAAYTTPSRGPSMSFFRYAQIIPRSFMPSSINGADKTVAAELPNSAPTKPLTISATEVATIAPYKNA